MRLKDISNLRTGLVTARKKASAVDEETYSYKAVTLKSFNHNGCLSVKYLDNFTSKEKIKEIYLTQANDVLIRLREPNIALDINEKNSGLVIPSFVASLRVDETKVDSKFLTYYLNSTTAKRALNSSITGTAINMIKTKELEDLEIKLPSLEEQKKIVEFLDLASKEIDLLEELKNKKEKYYRDVFNKIINQEIK
ncbi:MAG: restriction endonuclease subunit S [Sulfurimonas sp.]|nr:restriction endonuclease subunit S [Sulfurimonas sp.]